MTKSLVMILVAITAVLSGCDYFDEYIPQNSEQHAVSITADGQGFVTCGVYNTWVDSKGNYAVRLHIAGNNAETVLRGVQKLTTTELPKMVDAPMPYNPTPPTGMDKDGKPYVPGVIYTWADGGKAQMRNGQWVAVKEPNPACKAEPAGN